jgi:hypothetical protein
VAIPTVPTVLTIPVGTVIPMNPVGEANPTLRAGMVIPMTGVDAIIRRSQAVTMTMGTRLVQNRRGPQIDKDMTSTQVLKGMITTPADPKMIAGRY